VMHAGDGREPVTLEDALGRADFTFERGKFRDLCITRDKAEWATQRRADDAVLWEPEVNARRRLRGCGCPAVM
jgi:hypothetical protein